MSNSKQLVKAQAGHAAVQRQTVVIIDDHPVVRVGITHMLHARPGYAVVGDTDNSADGIRLVRKHKPTLVIVDISLPTADGIEVVKQLRAEFPRLVILVLTIHDHGIYAKRVLRAGANGYVMKESSGDLLSAIEAVLRGETVLSKGRGSEPATTDAEADRALLDRLSDRELQVFRLIGEGLSTRVIAERLSVSVKTVESYREAVKAKLNLRNSGELVQRAVLWRVAYKG